MEKSIVPMCKRSTSILILFFYFMTNRTLLHAQDKVDYVCYVSP